MVSDTIAAISTSLGNAGISIVRLSGDKAIEVADKVIKLKNNKKISECKSHTIKYGHVFDANQIIDEVLVSIMKAPNTFTRDDVIEINCHGGIVPTKKILELILENGARIAEPGEFTKRAFLNGRIDLSQAESIIDIIHSKTEISLKNAVSHLSGHLSTKIGELRKEILALIAYGEVCIDYPEDDLEEKTTEEINDIIKNIDNEIDKFIKSAESGKILKEGINTVIVGKPNVGKSSLLNELLKEKRAIVTDIPGTTRDIIEEYVNINGIPLKIIDTAGIRNTEDVVEKIGVEKSKEYIEKADLVFMVLDASTELSSEDIEILTLIDNKNTIVILNKVDLEIKIDKKEIEKHAGKNHIVEISVLKQEGIHKIEEIIKEMFFEGKISNSDELVITNTRHKNALVNAKKSINEVISTINNNMPIDCVVIDLKKTYEYLGEIIGESIDEDIIDKIFKEFCLGK